MIDIRQIKSKSELEMAFQIREEVYILEQSIDRLEEFDEWDKDCHHVLAFFSGVPCGTARWRLTDEGAKLERFAVLKSYRKRGIGTALVKKVKEDINNIEGGVRMYLNAQIKVMEMYQKEGFMPEGEIFMECNIPHQRMVLEEKVPINR
ncbi:MAG: GNAT family N-acetyltransferase [Cyclobacteriaceae bacterium]|nr:GNAT family N-acetyltransferase [Cyclobacteriaceae bacterium]